jgi:selenide,water dikinase
MIATMPLEEPALSRLRLPVEPGRAGAGAELSEALDGLASEVGRWQAPDRAGGGAHAGVGADARVEEGSGGLDLVAALHGFPPPLPDPATSGEVTAVHTLGALLAAGGVPLFALALVGLPPRLPDALPRLLLRGAERALGRAGASLAGARAVRSAEAFFGLAVVGRQDPAEPLRPDGARPGDRLVLTKPLGTGLVLAGQGHRSMRGPWLEVAVEVMTRLDAPAAELARRHRLGGCVHVGGSGLLGACATIARAARCRVVVEGRALPALPGAWELAAAGVEDEGATRVREAVAPLLSLDLRLDPLVVALAADPQTAGGLLLAVPPTRLEPVLRDLAAAGTRGVVVGRVEAAATPEVVLG